MTAFEGWTSPAGQIGIDAFPPPAVVHWRPGERPKMTLEGDSWLRPWIVGISAILTAGSGQLGD